MIRRVEFYFLFFYPIDLSTTVLAFIKPSLVGFVDGGVEGARRVDALLRYFMWSRPRKLVFHSIATSTTASATLV